MNRAAVSKKKYVFGMTRIRTRFHTSLSWKLKCRLIWVFTFPGIEAAGKETSALEMKSHMLAKLETNLQQVLSPGTFQKMKIALKDPNLAKQLANEFWYDFEGAYRGENAC